VFAHLRGSWRPVLVIGAFAALYLVLTLLVQNSY